MKSLTSLLTIPYDGLKALSYVFHYEKPADFEAPYAVWQETGESDFASNNRKSERALEGVIDFYTQTENDSKLDEIECYSNHRGVVTLSDRLFGRGRSFFFFIPHFLSPF